MALYRIYLDKIVPFKRILGAELEFKNRKELKDFIESIRDELNKYEKVVE